MSGASKEMTERERTVFENAMRRDGMSEFDLRKTDDGSYRAHEAATLWRGWQAARASLPPPSAEPVESGGQHLTAEQIANFRARTIAETVEKFAAASPPIQVAPSGWSVPVGFQRLETVKYWADAFADDVQRVSGRIAGAMIVKLLNEYVELRTAIDAAPVPQVAPDQAMALLRKIVDSDVGRDTLHKLGNGQGVETSDGKAWLAAKAATAGEVAPEQESDIDERATAELHAILAKYPPESWAVRNRALEDAAKVSDRVMKGTEPGVSIRALISKEAAPASPSAEQLWQEAISQTAFYVLNHCADGEHHSEAIMSMPLPKVAGSKASADSAADARLVMQGVADCMDMVRGELIEAGIIGENVAPMFIANAVCARIAGSEQDAARYRWLVERFGVTRLPCFLEDSFQRGYIADGKKSIDSAIDIAMQPATGKEAT